MFVIHSKLGANVLLYGGPFHGAFGPCCWNYTKDWRIMQLSVVIHDSAFSGLAFFADLHSVYIT